MKIQICLQCKNYTLKDLCPRCGEKCAQVGPARYSPQDPYGHYRRLMKESMNDG